MNSEGNLAVGIRIDEEVTRIIKRFQEQQKEDPVPCSLPAKSSFFYSHGRPDYIYTGMAHLEMVHKNKSQYYCATSNHSACETRRLQKFLWVQKIIIPPLY